MGSKSLWSVVDVAIDAVLVDIYEINDQLEMRAHNTINCTTEE